MNAAQPGLDAALASNRGWGGAPALSSSSAAVGAFALPATSRDAALLPTLAPGNYVAQVTGTPGAAGVVLLEIHDVP